MNFFRQLSIYTLVGFFGAGVNFLLLPYLTKFLTPQDYGILALVNTLVTILIPAMSLMANGLINVEYYRLKDPSKFASLFTSIQLIPILPFLVLTVLTWLFQIPIAEWLEIPSDKSYWIPLCSLVTLLSIYHDTLLNFTITEQRAGYYSFFNIFKIVVEIGLTVYLITWLKMNWEGRLIAWMISLLVSMLFSVTYFYRRHLLSKKIEWSYVMMGVSFGAPLILHTGGKFIINQSDRLFIAKMVSIEEAGVYTIGYQVGMVVLLFVNAAGNFFQPYLFERLAQNSDSAKREIVRMTYILVGLFTGLLLTVTIATPFVFEWFLDKRFAGGVAYVFWVGLSYLFWGIYILMAGYIFFSRNNKFLGYLSILNICINLILNYIMIQQWGALGAAYATCISFFIVALLIFMQANKLFPMPWMYFVSSRR